MPSAHHCCGCADQRYVVLVMVFVGIVISHIIRNSLSLGIIDIMIQEPFLYKTQFMMCKNPSMENNTDSTHPYRKTTHPYRKKVTVPYETDLTRYRMSETKVGRVFGSFYIGYLMSHVPGVVLSDTNGPKIIMGIGVLISSVCCFFIPTLARSFLAIYFVRLIMGLSQGLVFPASNILIDRWLPPNEGQAHVYLVLLSTPLGAILCFFISGVVISVAGYHLMFYFWGTLGIIWAVLFFYCVYDDRFTDPFIKTREKMYLDEIFKMYPPQKKPLTAPVCSMLNSLPVWAYVICVFGHNYLFFTMLNFHPRYIKSVFMTKFFETGLICALPYVFLLFTAILSEMIMSMLYEYYYLTHDTVRRFSGVISQVGPGFACATAIFYACTQRFSVLMTCIGMALMGPFWSATKYSAIDLTPNYAGFLVTVSHSIAVIAGWISCRAYSAIVRRPAIFVEWEKVFLIAAIIITFSGIFFGFFMRTKVQKWNNL